MKHSIWTRAASTLIAAAALLAAACGGSDSMGAATSPSTLKLANVGSVGNYLADGNGRALYYFALDLPAGGGNPAVSNCSGMCVSYWPIFHTASVVVQGIDMKDVGQMTRADGSQQTTYKGWPLYYYVGDTKPSDITGDASTGGGPTPVWFLLRSPFYTVLTLTDGATGATRLADAAGNSLYTFNLDTVGSPPTSACDCTWQRRQRLSMVSDAATASLNVTAFWTAVLMSGTNGSLIVPLVTSCPVIVMLARTVCVPAGTTSLLVVYWAEPASPT